MRLIAVDDAIDCTSKPEVPDVLRKTPVCSSAFKSMPDPDTASDKEVEDFAKQVGDWGDWG